MAKFINISNHPVSKWPVEQLQCAYNLSGAPKIDEIRFPKVPTDAQPEEIHEMSADLLDKIEELADGDLSVYVLVQGEASLSHCLVNDLYQSYPYGRFVPICATVERFVEPDEEGNKRVRHEFVMFRQYTM